jgi:UDP-N-acetylmuramate--alanine ligase
VAAAAWVLAVAPEQIADGLASFPGVGRRLEVKGEPGGVTVYDDYGHHPTAIAASIEALRERHPGRRLWAVYEPLTFHRTAAMLDAFADVLGRADGVAVADIWAGRDPDTSIASPQLLAAAVRDRTGVDAIAPGSVEATADALAERVERGDVVLVMGGGRSYVIAERLVALLGGAAGSSG